MRNDQKLSAIYHLNGVLSTNRMSDRLQKLQTVFWLI